MAGLYIHIPFCKQACHYCDFHFSTNQELRQRVVEAISKELKLQREYLNNESIETIYWGGGTPSILLRNELEIILDSIFKNFSVVTHPEITLEANPDDLTFEKLALLKKIGTNRLSIGIQSFDDSILQFFNRAHNSVEAEQCISIAREAGFNNISIDLIHSTPGQSLSAWKSNIEKALALRPEHISAYSLTIEEKTTFGQWQKKGKLQAIDEKESAEQFELLIESLTQAGYEHYEISNFSKPGFESKHNSSYWKQKKYLGIGPSAHSYDGISRQYNISNNHLYVNSIESGKIPFEREVLTRANKINEYIFTTLRTMWGTDLGYLEKELDYRLAENQFFQTFLEKGLVVANQHIIRLTSKGKLLADQIASDLFISE